MSNEKNKKEMVDDYVDYMDIDAISDEIIDLLKHKRYAAVRNRLTETNVVDIAGDYGRYKLRISGLSGLEDSLT